MTNLPPIPLTDEVLEHIDHALASHIDCSDGQWTRVGGEFGLSALLDLLAGHDRDAKTLIGYTDGDPPFFDNGVPIYRAETPTYSEHDLIAALVAEVRRLRALAAGAGTEPDTEPWAPPPLRPSLSDTEQSDDYWPAPRGAAGTEEDQ